MEKRAAVTRTVGGGTATVTATADRQNTAQTAAVPAVQTIYVQQVTVGAGGIPGANGGINIPTITNGGVPVVTVTSVPVVTMSSSASINTSHTQIISVGPGGTSSVVAQSAGLGGVGATSAMSSGGSSGLSGGAIAGIVIGSIAGAALLLGLVLLALARRRENERRALASDSPSPSAVRLI